jgi:hypothetical protein
LNKELGQLANTHLILLKYYEILASGSLLLCPKSEEKQLNNIGLYSDANCIICSMEDIEKIVSYITDEKNRGHIDVIRKAGQEHAINSLNGNIKYQQFREILGKMIDL